MSDTINQAFIEDFESLVYHLGQQEMSRCRNSVRNRTGTGDIYNYERLAKSEMTALDETDDSFRTGTTPIVNAAHSRRKAKVETWEWGEIVQNADLVRIIIDPESEYLISAAAALGRRTDQIILGGAVDGSTQDAAGTTVGELGAGQFLSGSGGKLTLDDLRQAKAQLDAAEVGVMQGGERYCVISAKGLQDLLEVTEVASSDYNTVKALVQGELNTFMGFNFIRTELLPVNGSGAAGTGTNTNIAAGDVGVLFYERSALGLSISDDRFTRVGEDASRRFGTRVYCQMTMGIARIEDEGVICKSILAANP